MASEVANLQPSATDLTEEELLLGSTGDINIDHDLDEEALLGLDSKTSETGHEPVNEAADVTFDREELDYDDDDDDEKQERSKFASERAKPATSSLSVSSTITTAASVSNTSNKSGPTMNNRFANRPKPPSLLGMQLPPPSFNGGKILVNPNFIPNQPPLVRLNMPGAPPISMCPPSMPSAFIPGPGGPIIPRLPNGIPLVGLPPNHGVAGFGPPAPQPLMGAMGGNWDQAVNAFLNKGPRQQQRSSAPQQHHNRRRRSSSCSSRSSYSSRSSSRSRSPRRRRGGKREESGSRRRSDERRREKRDRRSGNNNSSSYRRGDRRRNEKVTEECAKVVGVDNDYLSKLEEQKRKRDELLRKKQQRRYGGEEVSESSSRKSETKRESNDNKKAYLCVVIKNMKHLPQAQQKIEKLAIDIGPITKCWRFNDDCVHLIFHDHAHAKDFLVKFNGKVLSGERMQVHVEKAYLNLAEIK